MKKRDDDYRQSVIDNMNSINRRLYIAQQQLDYAADDDLIDSIIYEMKALQTQYTYYNKICRRLGIHAPVFSRIS